MLRNRGVYVTEHKIRQDVLRAYEYDIFDVPRWRYMQDLECQAHVYRQPRYRTVPRPMYHTARSSVSNYGRRARAYGARRVYLPENEWGASSVESMVVVRNPKYNIGSYYPNETFEMPFRRDFRYSNDYYSGRASSIFMDNDEIERFQPRYRTASYCPRRPTQLSRKVTRKLSPIFTCDCATTSNVKPLNKTKIDNAKPKPHDNHLSTEAKNLSLDIYKILSLLRKVDEDEDFSSLSLLQNIQDLDCQNPNSVAKLITQRVQISPKMKKRHDDPSEKFKVASGVRSKLEALVHALKQYEAEKMLNELGSSDAANDPKNNNVTLSDPPSLDVQSFIGGRNKMSSTNTVDEGKQKDMVLQTEVPKTSNKNVCSQIKTKKDNMIVERKSLRSRLSWKKKEATGMRDSNDRLSEDKKIIKTKSKDRFLSMIEAKQSPSGKNMGKQSQATNKAGLMIKIGGSPQRKKTKIPKEKQKDKMPKTWIRKFLDSTKDSKNNSIHIRWNNKAFNTKSSSTVVELVNNVYKQLGIKDYAKSDDISVSDIKKVPKKSMHKSKSRIPKSANKPKHKQKLKAYMMPQTIVPGPVYMPESGTKTDQKHKIQKVISNTRQYSLDKAKPFENHLNTISFPSSNYFEIHLPKDFFGPVSTPKDKDAGIPIPSSDEQVYKIIEYQSIQSDTIDRSVIDDDGLCVDQKYYLNDTINNTNEDFFINMVQLNQSLCFTKRIEDEEHNVARREPEFVPNKSRLQLRDFPDQETASLLFPRRSCSLVDKIMEDAYLNWMPLSFDSLAWSNNCNSADKIFSFCDQDVTINSTSTLLGGIKRIETTNYDDMKNKVENILKPKEYIEVFGRRSNYALGSNLVRLENTTKNTKSESLIGIYYRKPLLMSLFWSLYWGLLTTPKQKSRPAPKNLSLIQPPKIASEPQTFYKPQNRYRPQLALSKKAQLPFNPMRLVKSTYVLPQAGIEKEPEKYSLPYKLSLPIQLSRSYPNLLMTEKLGIPKKPLIVEKLPTPIRYSSSLNASVQNENDKTIKQSPRPRKPSGPTKIDWPINDTVPEITEDLENASALDKLPLDMKYNRKYDIEPDVTLKYKKPPQFIRFIRSSHNIQSGNKIKFVVIPSVPLLQQQLRQLQLLLSISSDNAGNDGQELKQCLRSNICTLLSCKSEQQQEKLKSRDENRGQKKVCENSRTMNKSVNSIDMLPSKIDEMNPVTTCSKQEMTINGQELLEYEDKREPRQNRTCNSEIRKNKPMTYVTQISAVKNNVYLSDKPSKDVSKTASVKLSLKITKGDKITRISIKNRDLNQVNNVEIDSVTNFQEPTVKSRIYPMRKPTTKTTSKKKVKVFINITNINSEVGKNSENPIVGRVIKRKVPKVTVDNKSDYKATKKYSDSSQHVSVRKSMRPLTLSKSYPRIGDMCGSNQLPVYVMEATSPNNIYGTDLEDLLAVDETACKKRCAKSITAESYVNKLLNITADKSKQNIMKHVIDIKRMLNAMMMLNASEIDENIDNYSVLKERKEIVNMLSEINMKKGKTYDFNEIPKLRNGQESFDELESGDSGSRCNILTRKLNSHRRVKVDDGNRPTKSYFKEKYNIADNYNVPYLVNPMQHRTALKDLIFIDENVKIASRTIKSKKRKEWAFPIDKPIYWYSGKNKTKTKHTKKNTIGNVNDLSGTYKDHAVILQNIDPCKSQKSSFTGYKVIFKNDDPYTTENTDGVIHKADILQSQKIKKAVLQIYSETVANEDCLVAKIPKYLRL